MSNEFIKDKYKDSITVLENESILIDSQYWLEISDLIKNNNYDYLMSITAYDLESEDMLGLAYNFYSTTLKKYLEIRIEFKSNIEIFSITGFWKSADWHERECYDLMGTLFKKHPDLKRILLPDDWEGHPLRKDYKEPDFYNGMPVPKDKSYWE